MNNKIRSNTISYVLAQNEIEKQQNMHIKRK